MKTNYFQLPIAKLVALTFVLLITGCNNPASNDNHEEEHPHAEGAVLKMNGSEIVRIEDGQVQSGQIEVNEGEETPLITIYFLAEDGDEFQPDEPDFSLRWKNINTDIAEIEQHDEDGKWSFHVHGIQSGSTTVVFQLWHNTEEHEDYFTPEIEVVIN